MVKTVEVGSFNLPENVARNPYAVIGKYAVADFVEGDYILTSKVEVEPAAENAYLYHLDGKKQAISISVKALRSGFLLRYPHILLPTFLPALSLPPILS